MGFFSATGSNHLHNTENMKTVLGPPAHTLAPEAKDVQGVWTELSSMMLLYSYLHQSFMFVFCCFC